jgi:hypothetical protein
MSASVCDDRSNGNMRVDDGRAMGTDNRERRWHGMLFIETVCSYRL